MPRPVTSSWTIKPAVPIMARRPLLIIMVKNSNVSGSSSSSDSSGNIK